MNCLYAKLDKPFVYCYDTKELPAGAVLEVYPESDGCGDITWDEVAFRVEGNKYVNAGYPDVNGWHYITQEEYHKESRNNVV